LLRGTLLCGSVLIRFLFFCSEDARSARVADADYFPIEIEASTEPLYYEATNRPESVILVARGNGMLV
jgi:hypothetical protein